MTDRILLQGTPAAQGEELGRHQQEVLRQASAQWKARAGEAGLGSAELGERARAFASQINPLTDSWLAEARALGAAAGVSVSSLLAGEAVPWFDHEWWAEQGGGGGLAFAGVGAGCARGKAVLHLNRWAHDTPQCVISRAGTPGTLAYVALASVGELGPAAFVSEKGLAGCWQAGPAAAQQGHGLAPGLVLRAIAERSLNCRQALLQLAELQARMGFYTPGGRGVIFLFADLSGEILEVEADSLRHWHGFKSQGLSVLANQFQLPDSPDGARARDGARQRRLRELLGARPLDPLQVLAGARLEGQGSEEGICGPHTVSAFTALLGCGAQPGVCLVSLGSPRYTQPVLLFPECGVPLPLLDGTVWQAMNGLRLQERKGWGAEVSGILATHSRRLTDRLEALETDLGQAAREAMVDWSYEILLEYLDRIQEGG